MNPSTDNYALGKGIASFGAKQTDGSYKPHQHLGNATELNLSADIEKLEHFSSMSATKLKDKSVILSTSPKLAFVLDEFSAENAEMAAQGERTEVSQVAATGETTTITSKKGAFFSLGAVKISNFALATYTVNTDYILYPNPGLLFIPWASTIPDNTELSPTFDIADQVYSEIKGFTKSEMEGQFMYFSTSTVGPDIFKLEVWRLELMLSGDLALIGEDWLTMAFEGEILADEVNHADNPYFKLTIGA